MNHLLRASVFAIFAISSAPVLAQNKTIPEPVPLGTTYVYQAGNPNWYQSVYYYPTAYVSANPYYLSYSPYYFYPSPYPFGSTTPVFGLYSWDYGVHYPTTVNWYTPAVVTYPVASWYPAYYPYYYPYFYYYPYVNTNSLLPGRVWMGFGWW